MKKLLTFASLMLALVSASPVSAQYVVSSPQPNSNVVINKLVQNPTNSQFVKDLCALQINFLPGQDVTYRIDVTNTGQVQLTNLAVKDSLPNLLSFISGPGNFDSSSNTLNFTVDSLNPGETKSFTVTAKVKDVSQIPANVSTCLTNTAQVAVNSLFAQSSALAPVERPLAQTQQLPQTGPKETGVVLTSSVLFLLVSGLLYRKSLNI